METIEKLIDVSLLPSPVFKDRAKLSFDRLNDPDFALKDLETLNDGKFLLTCSKCHHCR